MAAVTPSTLQRENVGSLTLYIATFANTTDDGDTYASGLGTNVVGYWANGTDDPTQGKEGIDVSNSGALFTSVTFNRHTCLSSKVLSFIITVIL